MMSTRATALFAAVWVFAGFGSVLAATNSENAVETGQAHYLFFCANCHGVNGDGKGPMAELLKIAPADLTLLKQTGGAQSVTERVLRAVDGRHKVGDKENYKMPIFSEDLEAKKVIEIGEYLKTIQK